MSIKELKKKNTLELKQLADGLSIVQEIEEDEIKSYGWEGKQKGLLQVLWERGFIDESRNVKKEYTMRGKKDLFGAINLKTSLVHLMENCLDFINEKTLLQSTMHQLGITVHRSPKCHAELAGEGIEYSWGFSKNACRRLPLHLKRGKEKFRNSVRNVLSRKELTTTIIRKFARRA